MKLTEEQNYNEVTGQFDQMADIVQRLNEISKQLGILHRHLKSSYGDEYEEDEDEDEDWEDEDDEDEDDLDELDC